MSGHVWIKAPRSLFATSVCKRCGCDSMVKHYGKCAAASSPPDPPIDYEQVRRDRLDGGYEDLPPEPPRGDAER